ncbi:hypothetical protein [Pseudorhodoferax sp.]|uniref:hypothetical protein n=1 Tax=Pseudorhodoferax sp. TaxID=1993553 RepID=UPI002DD692F6|nr:hypothetical protein [Pseudorhodoferax sp.]
MKAQAPGRTALCALVAPLLLPLLLAACASRQPETPPPAETGHPPATTDTLPAPPPVPGVAAFERQTRQRALQAEAGGRWAEAALAWETLSLLRPADAGIQASLAAAHTRITDAATAQLATALAAQRRGDTDAAVRGYLGVLALDPGHAEAAEALRQIERQRSRSSSAGRFARPPAVSRSTSPMLAGEPARTANSLREHATVLARQGDVDGAIQLLRDQRSTRSDPASRALLADLHVQQAELLYPRDPRAASAALDAALLLDRRHAAALALRQQWQRNPVAPR